MINRIKIKPDQIGLQFRDGQFQKALSPGVHYLFDPFFRLKIQVTSLREHFFVHPQLTEMIKAEAFKGIGQVLDLRDWQRALIWTNGRFTGILKPGTYVVWTAIADVRIEVVDARKARFDHDELPVISRAETSELLYVATVERNHAGVLFVDGNYDSTLTPGRYAFWRKIADTIVTPIDLREQAIDVNGQDLMTADKVSLRLNAIVTYRVSDPRRAVCASDNVHQALYRASQLALREIVGQHTLDEFLDSKQQIADLAMSQLQQRAEELGLNRCRDGGPGCNPARRNEGINEQGYRGEKSGGGQSYFSPRGNCGHAQPGEYGKIAGRTSNVDAVT